MQFKDMHKYTEVAYRFLDLIVFMHLRYRHRPAGFFFLLLHASLAINQTLMISLCHSVICWRGEVRRLALTICLDAVSIATTTSSSKAWNDCLHLPQPVTVDYRQPRLYRLITSHHVPVTFSLLVRLIVLSSVQWLPPSWPQWACVKWWVFQTLVFNRFFFIFFYLRKDTEPCWVYIYYHGILAEALIHSTKKNICFEVSVSKSIRILVHWVTEYNRAQGTF